MSDDADYELYEAAAGDRLRVESATAGIAFDLEGSLTVDRAGEGPVTGVVTTAAHADAIHRLFVTGAPFTIAVTPTEGDSFRFEGCEFISSSGKWHAAATDRS